jgi:hypothetical protein
MKTIKRSLLAVLALTLAIALPAPAKDKKDQRGLLESMQSIPCGAKQRGLTGLGSAVASLGVEHVNSHEQLCPQYLLRTDQMDYHIRPLETKHPVVLPVGQEAEFRVKKDRIILRIPDGGDRKERNYQVVSMQPTGAAGDNTAHKAVDTPADQNRPYSANNVNNGANNGVNNGVNNAVNTGGDPQTTDHRPPQP